MVRPTATCRTIIDALGMCVDPLDLAVLVERANRAYSIGNYDDYRNQLALIKKLIHPSDEESTL